MTEYLYLFLRQVAPALDANAFGTTFKEVSGKEVSLVPIPVPPLAEQGRIIIRVQELHALCDRLEEVQRRKNHMRDQFRASAIHALTHAVSDAENVIAWERVDQHWSAISATSDTSAFLLPAVLHLATRGRLAERISSEGTGADVLEGVDLERDDLVRRSEIRQPTPRHIVSPSEMPYTIPEHWQWVRVEDLCTHIVDCLHRTPVYSVKGFPAIRTCDVEPGRVLVDQALLVDRATYEEQITRLAPRAGDVLYSREGGRYGIAAVVPTDVQLCLSQRMMHFRCAAAVVPEYFSWFLNSPLGFGQATLDVGGSASPHVNIRSIRQFVVPLPPTSEQQRIVRRLDQLNSLLASVDSAVEAKELAALGVAEALVASQAVS